MKFAVIFFTILVVSYAKVLDLETEWADFKIKFNKHYADETEELYRKGLFADKLKLLEAHNNQFETGQVSFSIGVNGFADLTHEEFLKIQSG